MKYTKRLQKDFVIILISILIAYALVYLGIVELLISQVKGFNILGSFIAGIFFTSVFTIAPASVALAGLINGGSLFSVAFWGAIGALFGDLLLFFFIKDVFAEDLLRFARSFWRKHFLGSFHFGFLKWLSPILGGFIIASPLPDELGLALMGLSKTRLLVLVPISFVCNFIGILALAFVASLF